MIPDEHTPDEQYWVEVGGDGRTHPYAMHRTVNRDDVEVVSSVSDEDRSPKRWVIVRDGAHEVWVKVAEQESYGYELQPDEQVSAAELEAITIKHAAIRDGESVTVEEAQAFIDPDNPEQASHALVALYYAAKADSDIPGEDVDRLREIMHEHTGHVDTSHKPTLRGILGDVLGDTERDDDS